MRAKPLITSENKKEYLQTEWNDLPVAFYISNFEEGQYDYIDWHWHEEVQYCLVIKGEVQFNVNKEEYVVKEGNGIFINARQVHTSKPAQSIHAIYYCFEFHPSLIYSDFKSVIYRSYVLPVIDNSQQNAIYLSHENSSQNAILESIVKVKTLIDQKLSSYELDFMIEIFQIWKNTFSEIIIDKGEKSIEKQDNERLRDIFQFIQDHYETEITLEMIADSIHLSRSECSRFFYKCTKQNLFRYINQYRINKSKELLSNTTLSIAQIANAVGFANQSYYTECFRKQTFMTPRQYRIKVQQTVTQGNSSIS